MLRFVALKVGTAALTVTVFELPLVPLTVVPTVKVRLPVEAGAAAVKTTSTTSPEAMLHADVSAAVTVVPALSDATIGSKQLPWLVWSWILIEVMELSRASEAVTVMVSALDRATVAAKETWNVVLAAAATLVGVTATLLTVAPEPIVKVWVFIDVEVAEAPIAATAAMVPKAPIVTAVVTASHRFRLRHPRFGGTAEGS